MTADPFTGAGEIAGVSSVGITDFEDRLVLVTPLKHETEVKTQFGVKDAVRCDFVVIDEQAPANSARHSDSLEFGGRIIPKLRAKIGEGMVLGVVGKEPTTKGNPAWVLNDPSDAQKQAARDYLAASAPSF